DCRDHLLEIRDAVDAQLKRHANDDLLANSIKRIPPLEPRLALSDDAANVIAQKVSRFLLRDTAAAALVDEPSDANGQVTKMIFVSVQHLAFVGDQSLNQ